jgi:hypothetical protein
MLSVKEILAKWAKELGCAKGIGNCESETYGLLHGIQDQTSNG